MHPVFLETTPPKSVAPVAFWPGAALWKFVYRLVRVKHMRFIIHSAVDVLAEETLLNVAALRQT